MKNEASEVKAGMLLGWGRKAKIPFGISIAGGGSTLKASRNCSRSGGKRPARIRHVASSSVICPRDGAKSPGKKVLVQTSKVCETGALASGPGQGPGDQRRTNGGPKDQGTKGLGLRDQTEGPVGRIQHYFCSSC